MTQRIETIKALLQHSLHPQHLEIIDDSHAHAGHAGAMQSGGGHFTAIIVADAFEGKTLVQRHQLVYKALGDLMRSDIHALIIKARSPSEAS